MSRLAVRTSVTYDSREGWMVRVRIEEGPLGTPVEEIVLGPFKDQKEADEQGAEVAKLVRKTLKMEKN